MSFGRPGVRAASCAALVAVLAAGCAARRPPATPPDNVQFGEASWYGIDERGRLTANGESMDPGAITAAHRTLPFGTIVEVQNLDNGRVIEVRINDRGPFVAGRIIDLSHEAARQLDAVRAGVVPVQLRILELPPEPHFTVQVGAFGDRGTAERVASELRDAGFPAVEVLQGGGVHRVRVGRFRDRSRAEDAARELARRGHDTLVMRAGR